MGADLSWYEQNNFGSYNLIMSSVARPSFSAAIGMTKDFGMARCSDYGDKPGSQDLDLGLSREGMIWEKLLTDSDGQYVKFSPAGCSTSRRK